MGRPKKDTVLVRFPVPAEAYKRFQRLAAVMSLDVPTVVRMCAALQLAQFEVTILGANLRETQDEREDRATRAAMELLPDLARPAPAPAPASDPTEHDADGFGFRPRSEVDGLVVVGEPLVLPDEPRYKHATWLNL